MTTNSAIQLASDPNFDVEKLFYYLDMHEGESTLISTLISDPFILLSLAEGINYRVLERHADDMGFDPGVFAKLKEMGLESWEKKGSGNNVWYGIVAADDLAISFRKVNSGQIEVFRGEGAADTARDRWGKLNMIKYGDEASKKYPGTREIDLIRVAIYDQLVKLKYENRYYSRFRSDKSHFGMRRRIDPNKWGYNDIRMTVSAAGPHKVNVLSAGDHYSNVHSGDLSSFSASSSFTRVIDKSKKLFKTPDELAEEIVKWVATECKHVEEALGASV